MPDINQRRTDTAAASDIPVGNRQPESFDAPSDKLNQSESAGRAASETSDPNFTAARRSRMDAANDSATTRMDTGHKLDPDWPGSAKTPGMRTAPARSVAEVMTADVEVCNPQTPLYYVAKMMEERDCGAIPVVASTDSMRPIGIVTDRDIVIRAVAKNEDALALHAGDVMSVELISVQPEMPLEECIQLMEARQVRRALVTDHTGRCCGIIAIADIARQLGERHSAELIAEISKPNTETTSGNYH